MIKMRTLLAILFSTFLTLSAFAHTPMAAGEMAQPFLKEFSVAPNPTTGTITLKLETLDGNKPLEMKVYSLIGQEMMKETIMPFDGLKEMRLDFSHLPKGIYMLQISNGSNAKVKRISVI